MLCATVKNCGYDPDEKHWSCVGTNLTFALPGAATNATQPVREQMFTGLSLDALAEAVGATPDEILGALPVDETQIVILLIDTALQNGDNRDGTAYRRRTVDVDTGAGEPPYHPACRPDAP